MVGSVDRVEEEEDWVASAPVPYGASRQSSRYVLVSQRYCPCTGLLAN